MIILAATLIKHIVYLAIVVKIRSNTMNNRMG